MQTNNCNKDFLGNENARNKRYAGSYTQLMQRALGGEQVDVLIGHHLCFELARDIATENEIPAADTLLFDHDIMTAVFGDRSLSIMQHLAMTPTQSRDEVLVAYLECDDLGNQVWPTSGFEGVASHAAG